MVQLPSFAIRLLAIAVVAAAAGGASAFAPGTTQEIRERIKPFGQLRLPEEADAADVVAEIEAEPRSGEQIYDQFCATCHVTGVAGAPRMEAAEWEDRIAKGMDTLYASTINGIGAMPPGGTCFNCSEDELRLTVDWMVEQVEE